jgi:glycosyltransferase involved in cell wall biosynthesis
MKITLFVHCFFPTHFYGTERYTLDLARNLLALGHEVSVISAIFPGEPPSGEFVSYYEYEAVPVYCIDKNRLPHTRIKDTYYQPEMKSVHTDLLLKLRPDLVHVTHLINHTGTLLETLSDLKIPTVATMTDFFGFCFNNKLEAANESLCRGPNTLRSNCLRCYSKAVGYKFPGYVFHALGRYLFSRTPGFTHGSVAGSVLDLTRRPDILRTCYQHYSATIAPTKFLRDAYIANGFTLPIREIRFGVDISRASKPLREPNSRLRLGFVGQLARHKGPDILIQAFRELPSGAADLDIFGSKEQEPQYMEELRSIAQGLDVHFRGTFHPERMAEILSDLDFLVIPSRWYENSPLVLLNALATHTPVIISDVEGMTEFVTEGTNGFTFRRGNVSSLAALLRRIIKDPARARRMTATTEYSRTTEIMTKDVLDVYRSVLVQ